MKILHSHRILLAVVPLIVVVTALWAAATQGPFYVGENSDPEYVYALNALNIIALRSPVHVDHPGTPLQTLLAGAFVLRHAVSCITGDCRSVIEEVVSDPERYLNFGRLILLSILAGTLFHAGRRAYAISGFLSAAVALQGVLFLFPVVVMSLARVTPEPMLMICSILFVLPFFELAFTKASKGEIDPADANRWAIVAGIAFAAGVASKITFLPLGALVFLFPSWRNWLRFSGAVAVAGFVLLLPISSRLQYFGTWVTSLLTHKGMYGGGEAGMPGGAQLLVSAKSLLVQETFLPVWVLALLIFSILLPKIRTPLLLAVLCCLAQFAIVVKHPGARYLLPSFAAIALGAALIVAQGGRVIRVAVAVLAIASCFPSWQRVSEWAEQRRAYNTSTAQIQKAIASAGNCQVIGHYASSDIVSNLLFGDEYTAGLHAPLLNALYPNAIRYNTFGGHFHGWASVNQMPWLLDQLRNGRCFMLQGSILVEAAWPTASGIERTTLFSGSGETLSLLSLPGVSILRQAPPPGALTSKTPGATPSGSNPPSESVLHSTTLSGLPPAGPGVITLEAETIAEGNAVSDKTVFGAGIGVLTTPKVPAFASYQLNIPKSDNYEIYARYATDGARPVSLLLNGKIVNKEFCGNSTGGYYPAAQRWFSGGVFNLPAGKTTIRLESNGPFPHIDKIALAPMGAPK